jgi:hypothetical protein
VLGPSAGGERTRIHRALFEFDNPIHLGAVGEPRQDEAQRRDLDAQLAGSPAPNRVEKGLARSGVAADGVGPDPGERSLAEGAAGDEQATVVVEEVCREGQVQGRIRAVDLGLVRRARSATLVVEEDDELGGGHASLYAAALLHADAGRRPGGDATMGP